MFKILITHNILWSKYKGAVFSVLSNLFDGSHYSVDFLQIAETESDRVGLTGVDLSYHLYPYKLLFKGSHSEVSKLLLVKALFLEIWRTKADMVVLAGYHLPEYWAMLLSARLKGKTIGVFCDSTAFDRPRSFFKGLLKRLFFSQCDVFFGYGERSREYLMSFDVPSEKIYTRCQAAALPRDYDMQNVIDVRAIAHSKKNPRYLFVGRLSPEKKLDDLLLAFKQVLFTFLDAELIIVGVGVMKEQLIVLAKHLGLSESVVFVGSKNFDELKLEYLKATCMVLPSISESWGLVVNEALSFGCPVVVSHRCGCVPELVIDGVTGYVFTSGDVNDLAKKMVQAVTDFADPVKAANQCLAVISKFTPAIAATQIFEGCKTTLARLHPNA